MKKHSISRWSHSNFFFVLFSNTGFTGVPVVRRVSLPNKNILGTLWPELGQLKFLRSLNLSRNRFRGQVPPYVADAIVLETLDLSYNAFTGVLPSFEKSTHLKVLALSNNQFEGDFPGLICDGPALRNIDMSKNAMKGVCICCFIFDGSTSLQNYYWNYYCAEHMNEDASFTLSMPPPHYKWEGPIGMRWKDNPFTFYASNIFTKQEATTVENIGWFMFKANAFSS